MKNRIRLSSAVKISGSVTGTSSNRRGSTLLIVLVLLGLLSILGVIFFTFARQEQSNAEYFSEAAKAPQELGLTGEVLFDFALEQIIVGTKPEYQNSALWSSRHSMLSNMLGHVQDTSAAGTGRVIYRYPDQHAFDGAGMRLKWSTGQLAIDNYLLADPTVPVQVAATNISNPTTWAAQRYDLATPTPNLLFSIPSTATEYNPLSLNSSPAANSSAAVADWRVADTRYLPRGGVGYTAPDINTIFLAYRGYIPNPTNPSAPPLPVVIPSYHRPQYLRVPNGSAPLSAAPNTSQENIPPGDRWYDYANMGARVLRPHPDHKVRGTTANVSRFLTEQQATTLTSLNPPLAHGFPFKPMAEDYDTAMALTFKSGAQGVWSNPTPTIAADVIYEYDVDNDLDGVRDGIWIDLDYPVQEDANGNLFVPIFSATIYDLDGLINLNAHGNLAANQHRNVPAFGSRPVGQDGGSQKFLSRSNQGLGPAEVNPAWALNARPGIDTVAPYDFAPHVGLYGGAPSAGTGPDAAMSAAISKEAANMELAMLLLGQVKFTSLGAIESIIAGRYGETALLSAHITNTTNPLPRSGLTTTDDNGDLNGFEFPASSNRFPSNALLTLQNSRASWPLDVTGVGSFLSTSDPKQLNRNATTGSHLAFVDMALDIAGFDPVRWPLAVANRLNSAFRLRDDPYEFAFYRNVPDTNDSGFDSFDSAVLQMREAAANDYSLSSRVAQLAPYNLLASNNTRGDAIRQRFSTLSSDRKTFSWPRDPNRPWEYSETASGSGRWRFPARGTGYGAAQDPFRPALRNWIGAGDGDYFGLQRRLSINGVVDSVDATGARPFVRPLTPHPDNYTPTARPANLANYYAPYGNPNSPAPAEVEAMARRDRQLMARDIYVTLYMLGGPWNTKEFTTLPTGWNVADRPASDLYTADQLREMAQFAVNVVDSLDRDSIITRFVYDIDLSNGWQVNDDYPDDFPNGVPSNSQFAEVFGIERAQLAINEVLAVYAEKVEVASVPTDLPLSEWNDEEDHYFLYVELKNTSPFPAYFNNGDWKIELVPDSTVAPATARRQLVPLGGTVAEGGVYVVGGATEMPVPATPAVGSPSVMKIDFFNQGGTPDFSMNTDLWVAPRAINPLSLDLLSGINGTSHRLLVGSDDYAALDGTTRWIQPDMFDANPTRLTIRLYRKQYINRTSPTSEFEGRDNRWVLVDEAPNVDIRKLTLQQGDAYPAIDDKLADLTSKERPQPLNRATSDFNPSASGLPGLPTDSIGTDPTRENPYAHSLGLDLGSGRFNSTSVPTWSAWQRHLDRDYASIIELFDVPLFGNEVLTRLLVACASDYVSQNSEVGYDSDGDNLDDRFTFTRTAGAKFVHPTYPGGVPATPMPAYNGNNANRWHRVLELFDVPSRVNRGLANEFDTNTFQRTPGKINWNMIRHPEAIAALIDDERVIDLATTYVLTTNPPGTVEQPAVVTLADGENLWAQFVKSRDSSITDPWFNSSTITDSVNGAFADPFGLGFVLPGLPGSQPFTGHAGEAILSDGSGVASSTIRRWQSAAAPSTPGAPVAITDRLAFEVGSEADHMGGALDPMIRHRLIAKMSQNGTTRSNTFVVFLTCKFFRATYDTANGNAVRIGGPLNDLYEPEYRGVYVVDRTKLEAGYDANQGTFDFRKFIEAGQVLEK